MRHVPRLYVQADLQANTEIALDPGQSAYLVKVMRLRAGDPVRLFNGRHGEWQADVAKADKRACVVTPRERMREQVPVPDLELAFAPVKRSRSEFIAEKATELGVRKIQPVRTQYTNQKLPKLDRLQTISMEAAEQTERLDLPDIADELPLIEWLNDLPVERTLVFCDEARAGQGDTFAQMTALPLANPVSVLIGPEGGFADEERKVLQARPNTLILSLGPRILRADTAAVSVLTLVQAQWGDWR